MKKKSINKILQTYIPKILANESHIDMFMTIILIRYKFKADRENLRKKLEIFYRNSCYKNKEQYSEGQRLIKGSYADGNEGNTIWVSSQQIVDMVKILIDQIED